MEICDVCLYACICVYEYIYLYTCIYIYMYAGVKYTILYIRVSKDMLMFAGPSLPGVLRPRAPPLLGDDVCVGWGGVGWGGVGWGGVGWGGVGWGGVGWGGVGWGGVGWGGVGWGGVGWGGVGWGGVGWGGVGWGGVGWGGVGWGGVGWGGGLLNRMCFPSARGRHGLVGKLDAIGIQGDVQRGLNGVKRI